MTAPDSTPSTFLPAVPANVLPGPPERLLALRARFASLPDLRMPGRVLHRLPDVLLIALCAMLSDGDCFTDMESFAQTQIPWLRTFMDLPHGAPSHDVFRNVFMALDPAALMAVMQEWCGPLEGAHVRIDGQTLRGSDRPATGAGAVHLLRAYVHERGISAGHAPCAAHENELSTLPALLDALVLRGATVTIDAMACQPPIVERLQQGGAHYLIALKANQKGARAAVRTHFEELESALCAPRAVLPATHHRHETTARRHGRYERRILTATAALEWFDKSWKWAGRRSVVHVERITARNGAAESLSRESFYYLSSLEPGAGALAALVRSHWAVESQHWVLDMTFGEDHSQVRDHTAARNLSVLRELSAAVLRRHTPKKSLRSLRKRAALDPAFRLQLLALAFPSHQLGA